MYVEDEVGGKSYAFDAAGYLIFVDRTAPDVSIKNIRINGKTYGTLDDYQAAGVVYGNEVTFDYDVTEVNSDLADITIELLVQPHQRSSPASATSRTPSCRCTLQKQSS